MTEKKRSHGTESCCSIFRRQLGVMGYAAIFLLLVGCGGPLPNGKYELTTEKPTKLWVFPSESAGRLEMQFEQSEGNGVSLSLVKGKFENASDAANGVVVFSSGGPVSSIQDNASVEAGEYTLVADSGGQPAKFTFTAKLQ
ncbi:hypothetical protein [Calycomorphotria hydatis]|uniref:Uncharacterized protein n=1 Tax=Calycomorphotria hydatis TaxID=2528027 RepID=A0A517T5Z6_9PLAN|nr:hypothetical protein [Calycomorphotria hydatis]QDT63806.1 hypothetical protein V22_10310 [Calycomorphotria hydatis]